jgi:hypothetical protein
MDQEQWIMMDTLEVMDTLGVKEPDYSHSASKAIMYALVLPGLGQTYNKKYYKIPIVWAALGGVGYAIQFNTGMYHEASRNYAQSQDETNKRWLEYWRRNVEISYISLILVYALQVVDAYVDAQLYNWDVNENLSMRVAPTIQPLMTPDLMHSPQQASSSYGITCSFNLKGK